MSGSNRRDCGKGNVMNEDIVVNGFTLDERTESMVGELGAGHDAREICRHHLAICYGEVAKLAEAVEESAILDRLGDVEIEYWPHNDQSAAVSVMSSEIDDLDPEGLRPAFHGPTRLAALRVADAKLKKQEVKR